jgi:hypothetical protein
MVRHLAIRHMLPASEQMPIRKVSYVARKITPVETLGWHCTPYALSRISHLLTKPTK